MIAKRLIILAYENSYMFHDSEMENMQNELKMRVIDLIFEEEAKQIAVNHCNNSIYSSSEIYLTISVG